MSLWAVLLTGLFAGGASCAAVQGGLLAGAVARRHPDPATTGSRKAGRTAATAPPRGRLADVAPVGAFLAGKLASHMVLGATLGLAGDAVQVAPRVRAYVQIVAGLVMVLLALDLVGVTVVRRLVPSPPPA